MQYKKDLMSKVNDMNKSNKIYKFKHNNSADKYQYLNGNYNIR